MRRLLLLAALASVGGCASTARGDEAGVRPLAELPAAHRELWTAWLRQDPDWTEHRLRAFEDQELERFLVENLAAEMVGSYVSGSLSSAHDARLGRYERARAELLVIGTPAVPTIAELAAVGDGAAAHACMDLLVDIGPSATAYLTGLLERDGARARERAALVLERLPPDPHGDAAVRDARTAASGSTERSAGSTRARSAARSRSWSITHGVGLTSPRATWVSRSAPRTSSMV